MYFFVAVVFVELAVVVEQHSPSEHHDDFAAVLVLALAVRSRQSGGHAGEQPGGQVGSKQQSEKRQFGGQSSEQPGGQVGSRQQSPPLVLWALASATPAHTPPTVSDSSATVSIHDRFVIG
jgi:hypothetical protein